MKRTIGVTAAAIVLWGCATSPPPVPVYQAATDTNGSGYVTAPAENGRFMVAYTGTKGMSREQVAQFALLRAAEFTAESGQQWFAVITTKNQKVQLVQSKEDLKARNGGGFIGGPGGRRPGRGG